MSVKKNQSAVPGRIDPISGWRSRLTAVVFAVLLFELVTGLTIYLLPFNEFNQFSVLLHAAAGVAILAPLMWFALRHWRERKQGRLSHYQLLGYLSLAVLLICVISGVILTWDGIASSRINYTWDTLHLVTGIGFGVFISVHLTALVVRRVLPTEVDELRSARKGFWTRAAVGFSLLVVLAGVWTLAYRVPGATQAFPEDYNWRFGDDRPFAPSLARVDYGSWNEDSVDRVTVLLDVQSRAAFMQAFSAPDREARGLFSRIRTALATIDVSEKTRGQLEAVLADLAMEIKAEGAVDSMALANSAGCGRAGCHQQIYEEWLPSAHRYSALDDMFQRVQEIMVEETAPEYTRYCAGCHDPISLFSGAKNASNVTLSAEGADEGASCIVCHSVIQADVQGNGDYTIRLPQRYVYENDEDGLANFLSGFLIRTYPDHHVNTYSRSLYKTPEFCAACHKQYIDKELNMDIGKVQGQNQYDSWRNSRWHDEDDATKTVVCRECHMPLVDSADPARGDSSDYNRSPIDEKHRSHRMLGGNQYIPSLQKLEGAEEHVALIEQWLQGEIDIPEIADKWVTGPAIRLDLLAPETVQAGREVRLQITLTNTKAGHDFPTGPLDMIESWIEVEVTDEAGAQVFQVGGLNDSGQIVEAPIWLKADGFDREGRLIDRHNLWDLVGASYKRVLYPGMTDSVEVNFLAPKFTGERLAQAVPGRVSEEQAFSFSAPRTLAPRQLEVVATLWYRKANPEFLDRVYGADNHVRSPVTRMSRAIATIGVSRHVPAE